MKKNVCAGLLFFLIALQIFQTPGYAETAGTGIIKAIRPLGNGAFEVTVDIAGKDTAYMVNDSTEIQSQTSAEKIKPGFRIYVPGGKGIKPSIGNISPLLKKEMNLPDVPKMPQMPQMPQLPSKTAMEKPRKLPLKKSGKKKKGPEEAPAAAPAGMPGMPGMGGQGQAPKEKPKEDEPKPQDKALYGPVDADKPLVNNKGEVDDNVVAKKVLKVEKTSGGIKLKLESAEGKTEETVFAPAKKVLQRLSPADLQEKMKIQIEAPAGGPVRKMTVIS